MKRPFEAVREIFSENFSRTVENDKKSIEFFHSFIIWLLSFSIAGLSLIISNADKLLKQFGYLTIKSVVIFLVLSIIFGIFHRIFLYSYQVLYDSNIFYVEGALSDRRIMAENPTDVSDENNPQTLVNLLLNDYDVDESVALPIYNSANEAGKERVLILLRKKYNDFGAWAKRDYEIIYTHINEVMKNAFGLTDLEIKNAAKVDGKQMRIRRQTFVWMFRLSCLSFCIAFILLAINF